MKDNYLAKKIKFSILSLLIVLSSCGDRPTILIPMKRSIVMCFLRHLPNGRSIWIWSSYSSDEALITYQVYEPPLQYAYLTRPFTLIPLTAVEMPKVRFEDDGTHRYSIYTITIKPGIYYQPHPAFAQDPETGDFLYHNLPERANYRTIGAFPKTEHPRTRRRRLCV